MKLHTDHHFVIGQQHVGAGIPCQDHALSGLYAPTSGVTAAYAVVSDGCSSGNNTDIGSRLITASTAKALTMIGPMIEIREQTPDQVAGISRVMALSAANHLGLGRLDMLATQVIAVVDAEGKAFTTVLGDGAVAIVEQDGMASLTTFEWNGNMPWYPHENRGLFIEAHGGFDSPSLLQKDYKLAADGSVVSLTEATLSAESGVNGITFYLDVTKRKISLLALLSDGINQVDKMSALEVVRSLLAFKSLSGDFVKRRLNRFVKDCKSIGAGPLDDLSIAAIAIEHADFAKQWT